MTGVVMQAVIAVGMNWPDRLRFTEMPAWSWAGRRYRARLRQILRAREPR